MEWVIKLANEEYILHFKENAYDSSVEFSTEAELLEASTFSQEAAEYVEEKLRKMRTFCEIMPLKVARRIESAEKEEFEKDKQHFLDEGYSSEEAELFAEAAMITSNVGEIKQNSQNQGAGMPDTIEE